LMLAKKLRIAALKISKSLAQGLYRSLHLFEDLYDLPLSVPLLHSFLLVRGNSTSFWYYLRGADHSWNSSITISKCYGPI
jgi:hypothetical protein